MARLHGIVETVKPITYGEGLDFLRITVGDKQYDTHSQVALDPGDYITFNLIPDLFGDTVIPFIKVLSFTNRFQTENAQSPNVSRTGVKK